MTPPTAEHQRLLDHRHRLANWKKWGPYLSERAWGTVREDYSHDGNAWAYFPHDQARSRTYRWNEDGLGGISDRNQHICIALALWNGKDAILKERLFGVSGPEGNHGEDVKEYYFYLDNTPTHTYMKMLYKYPQAAYPYTALVSENRQRGLHDLEYELLDTGIFDEDRYFDVVIEYAKASENDILIQYSVTNRGPDAALCHILPTIWFRNTWSWGYHNGPLGDVSGKPLMHQIKASPGQAAIELTHPAEGTYYLYALDKPHLLFTENETNYRTTFGYAKANVSPYMKDAFHRYLINRRRTAINWAQSGTKAAAHYHGILQPGETRQVRLRLTNSVNEAPFSDFDAILQRRITEADEFYASISSANISDEAHAIQRQALAGMLWSKQLYYYDIEQWLVGDPDTPPPPPERHKIRNGSWRHLHNFDVISMPDKWEYPWYATWDTAFHCLPLVTLDPDFAKRQLEVVTREWYMHPNGQLPAYEWNFEDVNPPVHAWATWRVYEVDGQKHAKHDRSFLEGMFHKLLLNFTWWVNRKDADDNNVFQGGFLGMDNISVFDRSKDLPGGGHIDQSDGTAWMGFYCLEMMRIALELARENPVYQDTATKFFEHFLRIAAAMNGPTDNQDRLWEEEDGFFYDMLHLPDGTRMPLKVRSLVGLLPLIAVEVIDSDILDTMQDFSRRADWFLTHRPDFAQCIASIDRIGSGQSHLMAILDREQLIGLLRYMLDENEFLSDYGIRSLSKYHQDNPFSVDIDGQTYSVRYVPAESDNMMFGGNSNWRGPVWFPINFLIIEALHKFHRYFGDDLQVECPTHSGNMMSLAEVADELSRRLIRLFERAADGKRPVYSGQDKFQDDPNWHDFILFYEYFNGDDGAGLGASHQTGWTGLVATLIEQINRAK